MTKEIEGMRGGLSTHKMHPEEQRFGDDIQSKIRQYWIENSSKENRTNDGHKKEIKVGKQEECKTIASAFDASDSR
jgi:hypothetical protein